jgi:hypothetical protein
MNKGIEIGAAQLYDAGHGLGPLAPLLLMAFFAVAGLVLMYLAVRTIRRRRPHALHHHKDRYTVHPH